MILTTLLGIFGGKWIDQQLKYGSNILVIRNYFRIGAGFYSLWSELINLQQEESRKKMPTPGRTRKGIVREDDNKQK